MECVAISYIEPGSSAADWSKGGCCNKNSMEGYSSVATSLKVTLYARGTNTYLYGGKCDIKCPSPLVINSSLNICECVKNY